MATTVKNTKSGAKKNILSNATLRYVGLITAFVGIAIWLLGRNVTPMVLNVSSIIVVLIGLLLVSGNIKALINKKNDKDVIIHLLLGLVALLAGILLYIYAGDISKWIDIIVGSLIALYGVIMLINFIINKRKKLFIMDIIVASLLIACGVMLALMYEFPGRTYVTVVGILSTVTGVSCVVLY